MSGPHAVWLPDGKRLHLQHGPIDLIIEAVGSSEDKRRAYSQAIARFETVLAELVEELPRLRCLCPAGGLGLKGPVARRMEAAVLPFTDGEVTPMAAVAGAVADEVLASLGAGRRLEKAYVNNGGDIALMLGPNAGFEIAMAGQPAAPALLGKIKIGAADGIGGIATSGRHGRSYSLGIADMVTVLGRSGAIADVAATLIANAVDLPGHPGITRCPASDLDPSSDLGERLVTVGVACLKQHEIETALAKGAAFARSLIDGTMLKAAALCLADRLYLVGEMPALQGLAGKSNQPVRDFDNNALGTNVHA